MKAEIKHKWLEALRSGRYKKGTGALRQEDRYCCLGVLCNLHAQATGGLWEDELTHYQYMSLSNYLPPEVVEWAQLDMFSGNGLGTQKYLACLNDLDIYSGFNRVIEFIEKYISESPEPPVEAIDAIEEREFVLCP